MSVKIIFNPKCSKCNIAKRFLEKHNKEFKIIEYLEEGITKKGVEEILDKTGLDIEDILRKEEAYKKYIENKDLSSEEKINLLVKHPEMLQRPIIVGDKEAVIGRDKINLDKSLKL